MRLRDGRHRRRLGIPASVFAVTEAFPFLSFPRPFSSFPFRSIFLPFFLSLLAFSIPVQRLPYSSGASAVKGQLARAKLSEFKSNQRYGVLNQKGRPMKPRLYYRIPARESVSSELYSTVLLDCCIISNVDFLLLTCNFASAHYSIQLLVNF